MTYVVLGFFAFLVAFAIAFTAWRFRRGGAMEAGGSLGHQLFGRDEDDWGPKPS